MRTSFSSVVRFGALNLSATLLVGLLQALPAHADHDHSIPPRFVAKMLGGDPILLPNGLYQVTLSDGYVLTTHGPDPADGHGSEVGPDDPERAPICATGNVMHVLYGYPAVISGNRLEEVKDDIQAHIRRINAVLNEAALESGGTTADYKVLCDENGEIRVDGFSNSTLLPYTTNVFGAARQAGFDDPNVDYVIFYDDNLPTVCGWGEFHDDTTLSADNLNNSGGYGMTYRNCWFSRTPMHENGHTQGAVQSGAPNEDGAHHCTDHEDVMCTFYPPDPVLPCPETEQFDCGYDTYFDAAPEPGEWLASHWNIGSRLNRYIVFGDTPIATDPDPEPDPVTSPEPSPSPDPEPTEPKAEPVDPGAVLEPSTYSPQRGRRFTIEMWLTSCLGHQGSEIQLQRKIKGIFKTVARRSLDDDCSTSVRLKANFKQARFRSVWAQQDDDHQDSYSPSRRVRTIR